MWTTSTNSVDRGLISATSRLWWYLFPGSSLCPSDCWDSSLKYASTASIHTLFLNIFISTLHICRMYIFTFVIKCVELRWRLVFVKINLHLQHHIKTSVTLWTTFTFGLMASRFTMVFDRLSLSVDYVDSSLSHVFLFKQLLSLLSISTTARIFIYAILLK